MRHRLTLLVSLAGLVLAAHLWVVEERGLGRWCPVCGSPALQAASRFGGVPVAALGVAFYLFMAVAAAIRLVTESGSSAGGDAGGWREGWRGRIFEWKIRAALVLAFGFSLGLVLYQARVAHAFCPLCLGSAGLVVVLVVLEVVRVRRGRGRPSEGEAVEGRPGQRGAEGVAGVGGAGGRRFLFLAFAGATALLAAVLVGLDRVGRTPACGFVEDGAGERGTGAETGRSGSGALGELLEDLAGPQAAWAGQAVGVPVVAFLDPNCGHCREAGEVFLRLAGRHGDRARFVVVPRAVQGWSVDEVAALRLAGRQGRSFDLWRLIFAGQPAGGGTGLSPAQIGTLFGRLGLDAGGLRGRLAAERAGVEADEARAEAAGVGEVPALFIGGRRVAPGAWNEDCLGRLIEAVAAGQGSSGFPSVGG